MINPQFVELNRLPLVLPLGAFRCELFNWTVVGADWWEAHGWRNRRHKHSFYEITYVWRGSGWFDMLGTRYPLRPGDLFIAKPTEIHEIISSQAEPLEIYFWSHTLVPGLSSEARFPDALLNAYIHSQKWVSTRDNNIPQLLNLLTDEIIGLQPGYLQAIQGLATKLHVETMRAVIDDADYVSSESLLLRNPQQATLHAMVRYLQDNFGQPISLSDVAAQVYLSERHASRLFKQGMGVSIMHYLTTRRLEIAAQLLMDSQMSVIEVAAHCGYSDPETFTTLFRRTLGVVPRQYRQQGGTVFVPEPISMNTSSPSTTTG